ncbi:MAG TPA: dTMP kinase [Anaerolineales bacterium]|nr:dTMP kinase [Anaerolineales bacterium]
MRMFITLEGPDGSGKTSHVKPLAEWLEGQGYHVHTAREPGGTAISEQIRTVIHDLKNTEMNPRTETLLYQAARAQIVEQVIRPKLAAGWIVLCDRYADSTLAYQGYGHRQNLDEVRSLVRYATGGLVPDLTLLLDVDAQTGLSRRQKSGGEWNRLDAYQLEFHCRVRDGYLELVRQEPMRWVKIDAGKDWETVQQELRRVVSERIKKSA